MTTTIDVTINGQRRTLDSDLTAADLVGLMQLGEQRIAIEINGEIVPRSTYPRHPINAGDKVEIVRAVGGG